MNSLKTLTFLLLIISCSSKIDTNSNLKPKLLTATINNNKLVLTGNNLTDVINAEIEIDGDRSPLIIESKTDNSISFSGESIITLAINKLFNLIITDANAQETIFPINIELEDGTIEANHLSSMGASTGQILSFNGTSWVATNPLVGLHFAGTWNASTNTPDIITGTIFPETYYIVSTAGTQDLNNSGPINYEIGDWVIYNGILDSYERISNSAGVASFNGRFGAILPTANDYTWDQIDKTVSSINDIADVNAVTPTDGQVLTWNSSSSSWISSNVSTGANSITSTEIADGAITNIKISDTANISQSKIANLETNLTTINSDLSSKLPLTDGIMSGNLDMGLHNILNVGQIGGFSLSSFDTRITQNATDITNVQTNLTKRDLTASPASVLTVSGGTDSVFGSGASITIAKSSTSQDGYLSQADWNTFNNKADKGDLKFPMTNICDATTKGTLRFNDTYENYQFCDGTLWREVGNEFYASSRECVPADYAEDKMVPVGDYCVDKYEMSIWDGRSATATQTTAGLGRDGTGTVMLYAVSKKGVTPAGNLTWYQAAVACANSGKSLIPDGLWQVAALGTFDPQSASGTNVGSETDDNAARCNILSAGARLTGMAGSTPGGNQACISRYGVEDMVGNFWEWTDLNGIQAGPVETTFADGKHNATGAPFSIDGTWNVNSKTTGMLADGSDYVWKTNQPAAALRGGFGGDGPDAGVFALTLNISGSGSHSYTGARCARAR